MVDWKKLFKWGKKSEEEKIEELKRKYSSPDNPEDSSGKKENESRGEGESKEEWKRLKELEKKIRKGIISPSEWEEYKTLKEAKNELERLKEEERSKTWRGRLSSWWESRRGGAKEKIKGKVTETAWNIWSNIWGSGKFALFTGILLAITFSWFIPFLQQYFYFNLPGWFNSWFLMHGILTLLLIFLIVSFIFTFTAGFITGSRPFDYDNAVKFEAFLITGELVTMFVGTYGVSWICSWAPFFCDYIRCLVRYHNLEMCAFGDYEIKPEKEGTYKTLDLVLGTKLPDRILPPPNPVYGESYELIFSLINNNDPDSQIHINISRITVDIWSGKEHGELKTKDLDPPISIPPGMSQQVSVFYSELPNCPDYFYHFDINVTSKQHASGSSLFAVVGGIRGFLPAIRLQTPPPVDPETILEFNPQIKTEAGPIDLYVYTVPFVLNLDTMKQSNDFTFPIFIFAENKMEGTASIKEITLTSDSSFIKVTECGGKSVEWNNNRVTLTVNWKLEPLGSKLSSNYILCRGVIRDDPKYRDFRGTDVRLMSVSTVYEYTQTFNERIAGRNCVTPYEA